MTSANRYSTCPACDGSVDTWLAGTTATHRTALGFMHGQCYADLCTEAMDELGIGEVDTDRRDRSAEIIERAMEIAVREEA